jgi:hypothetical protein
VNQILVHLACYDPASHSPNGDYWVWHSPAIDRKMLVDLFQSISVRGSDEMEQLAALDVFVIAAVVIAFKTFPGGTRVTLDWGVYAFTASVILSMVATTCLKSHNSKHS